MWGDWQPCSTLTQGICTKEVFSPCCFSTEIQVSFPWFPSRRDQSGPKSATGSDQHERAGWVGETEAQSTKCCIPLLTLNSLKLEEACLPAQKPQGFTPPLTSAFYFFSPSLILFKFIACREKLHGRASSPMPRLGRQRACLARGCFTLLRTASLLTDCHKTLLCRCSQSNSAAAKVTEEAGSRQQQAQCSPCNGERRLQTPHAALEEVAKRWTSFSIMNGAETQK